MELNVQTFIWLRDLGCLSSGHVAPSNSKGMLALSTDALRLLQQGTSIIRLLKHYCCDRFDTPAALDPQSSEHITAKRHNWSIISKILKEALTFDLSWDRRELIIQGDVVEILVLLKQIHELVRTHRKLDKERQEVHRLMCEDPHRLYVQQLVVKPVPLSPQALMRLSQQPRASVLPSPVAAPASGITSPPKDHERPWFVNVRKGPPRRLPPIDEERKLFEEARRKRTRPLHLDYSQNHNDNAIYRPPGLTPPPESPPAAHPGQRKAKPSRTPEPSATAANQPQHQQADTSPQRKAVPAAAPEKRSDAPPPPPVRPVITDDDL